MQGACQNYKPTYLKLANALFEYVDEEELEVFAISCQVHGMVCDEFGVDEIPMVALFPEGEPHYQTIRKLFPKEKRPQFIIPYLFPHVDTQQKTPDGIASKTAEDNEEDYDNVVLDGDNTLLDKDENEGEALTDDQQGGGGGGGGDDEQNDAPQNADPLMRQIYHNAMNQQGEGGEGLVGMDRGDQPADIPDSMRPPDGADNDNLPRGGKEEAYEAANKNMRQGLGYEQRMNRRDDFNKPDDDDAMADQRVAVDGDEEDWNAQDRFQRPPPDPQALRKDASAGIGNAQRGKEMVSDMDRFKEGIMVHQKKAQGFFQRKQQPVVDKSHLIDRETGATNTMKAHMPGTAEFGARQKQTDSYLLSLMKKKGLRTNSQAVSAGAGGVGRMELPPNSKPMLPYKKEIQEPKLMEKMPIIKHMTKMTHEEELILDASLSFMTVLKHGVFADSSDPLSKSKKRALQGWFDLLRVSLPPEWSLHEAIMDLDNNFDAITMSSHNLHRFLKKHDLPRKEWSQACAPSKGSNGFNCGFWKLLHIITVGVAEHRGGTNLVEAHLISREVRVFSPMEAAETIKKFIEHFFPCATCRNHFVAQYDECSNRRCVRLTDLVEEATNADFQELAKWLWEVHNDVNVRLFIERDSKSAVHEQVQALFPSLEACVSCFKEDGTFDEDHIFLYIEKVYW